MLDHVEGEVVGAAERPDRQREEQGVRAAGLSRITSAAETKPITTNNQPLSHISGELCRSFIVLSWTGPGEIRFRTPEPQTSLRSFAGIYGVPAGPPSQIWVGRRCRAAVNFRRAPARTSCTPTANGREGRWSGRVLENWFEGHPPF